MWLRLCSHALIVIDSTMSGPIVQSNQGVTLVGAGELAPGALARALALAPRLVAADGGADRALAAGQVPELVIGDLDSLSEAARARLGPARLHRIDEQETTDFDKALRSIEAPFILALGFAGARLDHTLGMFNVLARHPGRRCVALGGSDLCFLATSELTLRLEPGTRLSLFPMGDVSGRSSGLRWPIDGIAFAPGGITGISNVVEAAEVRLNLSAPRMLVLLPAAALEAAIEGLAGVSD
jgi:thiamine pyrophosphokinase